MNWDHLWRRDLDRPYGKPSSFGSDDFENLHRQDDNGEPSLQPVFEFEFGAPSTSRFGENYLGVKSLTDLKDFIAAKDAEFKAIHDSVQNTPTTSPPWPPGGYAAWYKDYQALVSKWQPARAAALAAVAAAASSAATASAGGFNLLNPLGLSPSPDTQTGQPYYDDLLHIVQPVPMSITPGDLQDLHNRLDAVQKIPGYSVPQPTRGADEQNAVRNALAPYDPLGDKKAGEDWKRDIFFAGSILVGALFLASVVAKKV